MSIIHTFDSASPEILKPDCMVSRVEGFPKTVVITFQSDIIELVKSQYPAEEISSLFAGFRTPY